MIVKHSNSAALLLCLLLGLFLGGVLQVSVLDLIQGSTSSDPPLLSVEAPVPDSRQPQQADLPSSRQVEALLEIWSSSIYLRVNGSREAFPRPPHMENCRELVTDYKKADRRAQDGQRPRWTLWKGPLGDQLGKHVPNEDSGEELLLNKTGLLHGPLPPWVSGGDEDNLPMTRRAQHDLWLLQHPRDCKDPSLKFMFVDFLRDPFFGTGAQLMSIAGMFAVAVNEKRVFVLDHYNRADHDGCKGTSRSNWACYFLPETTDECRERAVELAASEEAKRNGTITTRSSYNDRMQWDTPIPEVWGKPWEYQQPTMQINNELVVRYTEEHRWWWRAQAWKYLTRYPSEYMCGLLNRARHEAFGREAAAMVAKSLPKNWPEVELPLRNETPIERLVWSSQAHRPWIPRPMLSLHVRQGDKAREMEVFSFESYMELARNVRARFPHLQHVWLSTEMQTVIEESKNYTEWTFHYSNITRQTGTMSMTAYETGLGRKTSSDNAFVNLFMAVECDFFVGPLGSTWETVIDGLRNTGGKVLAGIQSVNRGMYWRV